jgi:hypothetical protein
VFEVVLLAPSLGLFGVLLLHLFQALGGGFLRLASIGLGAGGESGGRRDGGTEKHKQDRQAKSVHTISKVGLA